MMRLNASAAACNSSGAASEENKSLLKQNQIGIFELELQQNQLDLPFGTWSGWYRCACQRM
jgi:hypothetical protein